MSELPLIMSVMAVLMMMYNYHAVVCIETAVGVKYRAVILNVSRIQHTATRSTEQLSCFIFAATHVCVCVCVCVCASD